MGARRSMVGVALVGVLVTAAGPARADRASKARAKAHLEAGLRLYNTQDFAGAIAAWRQAYVIDGNPQTLFAIGQAQRLSGDCPSALGTYAAVLREKVSATQAEEVRKVVQVCEEALAARPAVVDPVVDPAVQPTPAPGPRPAPVTAPPVADHGSGPAPWYKDGITLGLLGGGAAGLAVGATFFVLAGSSEDAARAATGYEAFAAAADQAGQRRTMSGIGFVGGGALVVAGLLYTLTRDGAEPTPTGLGAITPALGPTEAAFTWTGRF
ncbi:MAG: hypothetical protein KBG28_15590 [Kofleriaceae bacterium]|nr:hypothetical protein [Kofleriaceae bacterium]